ncbi:g6981 [Coccomyxa viridis]|uniref:G6981 protein n=1 Tax=Coccomyxa viridis TaxID=1274662 RepID=A0ABP1FZ82_9CHLO
MKAFARHLCLWSALAFLLRGQAQLQGAVKAAINRGARVVPADKGEVQDLKAEIAEYKTETSAVIDQLVGEVNSLTPGYNGTNGLNGVNGTSGPSGTTGVTGDTGVEGSSGFTGFTGDTLL